MKNENDTIWGRFKNAMGIESGKREMRAEDVYFRTKYGDIANADHYVSVAQGYIKSQINESVSACRCNNNEAVFRTFYCIVDLDPEMSGRVDEIFEPFVNAGFSVVRLSGVVEEVKNDLVFLVSWDRRK